MVRKEYVLEVEADMAFSQADVEMSGVLDREGLSRFLEQLCPERLRPDDAALDMAHHPVRACPSLDEKCVLFTSLQTKNTRRGGVPKRVGGSLSERDV